MFTERRVVENKVFLLGLDKLYRDAMKQHERGELLRCARRVAQELNVMPADVPVEGYYAEDQKLTEYFRLIRALQGIDERFTPTVSALPEFQRLRDVESAPLYGLAQSNGKLFPAGRDALTQALDRDHNWTVKGLIAAAYDSARDTDEISLVGLVARIQDAVVLTAVRESVVLRAQLSLMASGSTPREPRLHYVWKVDKELAKHARRFIHTFNLLFGEELPPPEPAQAELYWHAHSKNEILGRCVRLGSDILLTRYYHWAICRAANEEFAVQEFWKPEVWTTMQYRSLIGDDGRCPEF